MIVERVKLANFRSHEVYDLICRKKTTLIVGENGSGKTSVLEAIYEALQGRSFRAVDKEVLRRGSEFYRVELTFKSGEKAVVVFDGEKKTFLVGDKKFARLPRKMKYPVVLFLPSDLHLVEASPGRRREYFDRVLGGLLENYSSVLAKYTKTLRQRNELLKTPEVRASDLFSWNILLAKYGTAIRRARGDFIKEINMRLTERYRTIAENEDEVLVEYSQQGGELGESGYLERLEKEFQRDKVLGHTGFGAHRDTFEFKFNKTGAEGSASRGEMRSMILALKFIEAELIYEHLRKRPVILLDDVFSELDEKRQKCLVKNFKDHQVIITSVEFND